MGICHQLVHRNPDCSDPQVKLLVLLCFHGKNTFYNNLPIIFFYFIDSFEDLSTITMGLQEALAREKMLEDKLITVKNMINKNIGRSQTDLIRLFENVREELLNLYDQRETIVANSKDDSAIDKLGMYNVSN